MSAVTGSRHAARPIVHRPVNIVAEVPHIGAACANREYAPEWWFPLGDHADRISPDNETARYICNRMCSIREACLDGAIARGEQVGIWGGRVFTTRTVRRIRLDARGEDDCDRETKSV